MRTHRGVARFVPIAALALFGLAILPAAAARAAAPAGGLDESEPASSNIRVEQASDSVILADGTKVTGTIIAAGLRSIIIIETDQTAERVIPRSEVESFSYAGRGSGEIKGYTTGVNVVEGLPTIVGEGSAAPTDSGSAPGGAKPSRGTNGRPSTSPASKANKDLSKLWSLLGGKTTADELKDAVAANPQWRGEIRKLMAGEVPPDGAAAVAKFKERLAREPELRKLLSEWTAGQQRPAGNARSGRRQR